MAELTEGKSAPRFTLPGINLDRIGMEGDRLALKDVIGERIVVVYFYPRDNTKGCTVEAEGFRDVKGQFTRAGAVVIGISTDDIASHESFASKHKLNFPLLSDEDGAVTQKYGAWAEKKMYGKTFMGTVRSTFVIDRKGKIAKIWPKVSPEGHAREVLDFVKSMD